MTELLSVRQSCSIWQEDFEKVFTLFIPTSEGRRGVATCSLWWELLISFAVLLLVNNVTWAALSV